MDGQAPCTPARRGMSPWHTRALRKPGAHLPGPAGSQGSVRTAAWPLIVRSHRISCHRCHLANAFPAYAELLGYGIERHSMSPRLGDRQRPLLRLDLPHSLGIAHCGIGGDDALKGLAGLGSDWPRFGVHPPYTIDRKTTLVARLTQGRTAQWQHYPASSPHGGVAAVAAVTAVRLTVRTAMAAIGTGLVRRRPAPGSISQTAEIH